MKKKHLLTVLLILGALWAFSFFHVAGTELPSIDLLTGEYTGTVTKHPAPPYDEPLEYTLSSEQILALQELLQSSHFTRILSNSFSYKGPLDTYAIVLELQDAQGKQVDFIHITFIEDHYFSISAPYANENLTLKVHNDQLDEQLDLILAGVLPD